MEEIKLNLGCGFRHMEDFTNIDNREECEPDILCDIVDEGLPFDDNSVDYVFAQDFLEHIPIGMTLPVIEEIYRVLKPGGTFEHLTPSTDGRGAFMDPTHVSFWNINSWMYYMEDDARSLYGITAKFTGELKDHITSGPLHIIHTHGVLTAVKEVQN